MELAEVPMLLRPVVLDVGVALAPLPEANLDTRPTVATHWPMKTTTRRRGIVCGGH